MWLCTQVGFFSIVKSDKEPDTFLIRSRRKTDLMNLVNLCGLTSKIFETPQADYPCRIIVDGVTKNEIIAALADGIDYSNFKDRIHKTPGQFHKNSAYMDIWSIMRRTEIGQHSNRARATVDRFGFVDFGSVNHEDEETTESAA